MIPCLVTRFRFLFLSAALGLAGNCLLHAQTTFYLYTPAAGDANYNWNSRYGGDAYSGVGGSTINSSTSFYAGVPSDTQYTVGIFMIPISQLAGGSLYSATLHVTSNGFSYWWNYGTVSLGWLNTGSMTLSGDVVADGLGPAAKSMPGGLTVFNSDDASSGNPGAKSYDVATYIQADLDAGRTFSTFVLSGSRDTGGSLSSAEGGQGPYVVASSSAIPEPSTYVSLVGLLALCLAFWRGWLRSR